MNAWSAVQRQYLEAMGFDLMRTAGSPEHVAAEVTSTAPMPLPAVDQPAEAVKPAHVPAFSPQFQAQLARAAKMPFSALAERVYLPPDLAQNPHAKRAFWHVLKGARRS